MTSLAGKHYIAAIVWIALFGVLYFVIDASLGPKVVRVGAATEIVIPRSRDSHFYVAGSINGQAVTFLVDTGASTVSVGSALAARIGLPRGRSVAVGTAGGVAQGEEIAGQSVAIGGIALRDVRIVVLPKMGDKALLGQNVLRHLEVTQADDRLVLRPRPDSSR